MAPVGSGRRQEHAARHRDDDQRQDRMRPCAAGGVSRVGMTDRRATARADCLKRAKLPLGMVRIVEVQSPPGRSARAYQNRRARDSGPPGAVLAGPARCQHSVLAARAAHTAKADVVVPVLGLVPVPVRRPQVPRVVVPRGAPAQHAANSRKLLMDLPEVSMPYPAPVANRLIGDQCGRHIPTRTKPAAHPIAR